MVPYAFSCQVLPGFISHVITFFQWRKNIFSQWSFSYKVSQNHLEDGWKKYRPATWYFLTKSGPCHAWNFSEQVLCSKLRSGCFFFMWFVKMVIKKFYKVFTARQLLTFFKQKVFRLWKHALIKRKIFHLHQICWNNWQQKLQKILKSILKPMWIFCHRSN